ncbi:MAG: zinc ribbon domain-containing protein [Betaproteobacteria bacterium]|nr:zinc ribbon domain-containing protein [Betaproteobacteria bacterium]
MPIYEYRCDWCGHQQEFLQRMSDKPLTLCPECGKRAFNKLVSAAGFQLKGTGWYATDFRNSGAKPDSKPAAKPDKPADSSKPTDNPKPAGSPKPTDSSTKESSKTDASSSAGTSPASG